MREYGSSAALTDIIIMERNPNYEKTLRQDSRRGITLDSRT